MNIKSFIYNKFNRINMREILMLLMCLLGIINLACTADETDLELLPVLYGKRWGYIDHKGKYAINPQFEEAGFFFDGLARVRQNEKIGYIDKKGKFVIEPTYMEGTEFSEGLAFVVSEGGYPICINKTGLLQFTLKDAKMVYTFRDGLSLFTTSKSEPDTNGQTIFYNFVDKTGKIVLKELPYTSSLSFSENLALVQQRHSGNFIFIGKDGKITISDLGSCMSFNEGKAVFCKGDQKRGYVDQQGNIIINPQFDDATPFREDLAAVKIGGKWGYINTDGIIAINPQFDVATFFCNDLALVRLEDKWGYINKAGQYVINPQFENALPFYTDIAAIKDGDKWGFIDKKGKYIINPQFDDVGGREVDKSYIYFYARSYPFYNPVRNYYNSAVISNYYDATAFFNTFFVQDSNQLFKEFSNLTSLRDIVNNAAYGDYINATGPYEATCLYADQYSSGKHLLDGIYLRKTVFYFSTPVYKNISTYDYWGNYNGNRKEYNFLSKLNAIKYVFRCQDETTASACAFGIKKEIEKTYNVKMGTAGEARIYGRFYGKLHESNDYNYYYVYGENGERSFVILYDLEYLTLLVSYTKDAMEALISELDAMYNR